MNARKLRLPVTCPDCGAEQLAELPVDRVTGALREGRPLRLHAIEVEQVRQYVGALSLHHGDGVGRPAVEDLKVLQC
jgi:hypothetical protein